jgi:hypothetical protein
MTSRLWQNHVERPNALLAGPLEDPHLFCEAGSQPIPFGIEIESALKIQPELIRSTEIPGQAKRSVRTDCALPVSRSPNDLITFHDNAVRYYRHVGAMDASHGCGVLFVLSDPGRRRVDAAAVPDQPRGLPERVPNE